MHLDSPLLLHAPGADAAGCAAPGALEKMPKWLICIPLAIQWAWLALRYGLIGGSIIALAPPDELRRSATNGDLLDIQTARAFDGNDLMGQPGVGEVSQDSPRHFRVTVEDAATALPQIVERIRATGGEVESAQEHRLSFDEVFAILVARHGDGAPTGPEDHEPGTGDDRPRAAA